VAIRACVWVRGVICVVVQPSPNAQPNLNPIYSNPPTFVKSVPNGQLWVAGEADDTINIVHLWGWFLLNWMLWHLLVIAL
jgi:hypothetical protein